MKPSSSSNNNERTLSSSCAQKGAPLKRSAPLTPSLLCCCPVHPPHHTTGLLQVRFEIPYFTVSGIQVRYLKVIEKSGYAALPWVRYITQNGDYQLRMGGS